MDSQEKLGKLLSQYLSSETPENIPDYVRDAFHVLGLTEFASRENVESMYREKCDALKTDVVDGIKSRFSCEFEAQQKKELSEAYTLITNWLDNKE